MSKNMPNSEVYEKISEWLDIYHSTNNDADKIEMKSLIVSNMVPIVRKIARKIARRSYDPVEDLSQAGFIGLLKAIDRYSKERNDNFRVYAGYLIIGEMKHYLRDKLNAIRVPAHVQELIIRINNFTGNLTAEELMEITSDDVATALDIPTKAVDFALQTERRCSTISLEEIYRSSEENLGFEEIIADSRYKEKDEYTDIRILFDEVINRLPDESRVLLDMYYKQDMTQKEIAEALQMSQMNVSRKMKQIFNTICEFTTETK